MNPDEIEVSIPVHKNLRTMQVLDESDCAALVHELRQSQPIYSVDEPHRKCSFYELPDQFDKMLSKGLTEALIQYVEEVPELGIVLGGLALGDEGFYLIRYSKGDFHKLLVENLIQGHGRILMVHIWLNEDFRSGELMILPDKVGHKPMAGYAVIFPATWEYAYYSRVVEGGEKWVLTTFIHPERGEDLSAEEDSTDSSEASYN